MQHHSTIPAAINQRNQFIRVPHSRGMKPRLSKNNKGSEPTAAVRHENARLLRLNVCFAKGPIRHALATNGFSPPFLQNFDICRVAASIKVGGRDGQANVRSLFHLAERHRDRSVQVETEESPVFPEVYKLCTKSAQSSGPENIGPERPLPCLLAPEPVLSLSRLTLENNEKIRPRPDRENAFAGASGGDEARQS